MPDGDGTMAPEQTAGPTAQDDVGRRSAERNAVSYFGVLSFGDQIVFQVDLVDLSARGARMITPPDCDPPDEVVLKIPETGACFLSEIVWRNGCTYGVRFMSPLPG